MDVTVAIIQGYRATAPQSPEWEPKGGADTASGLS